MSRPWRPMQEAVSPEPPSTGPPSSCAGLEISWPSISSLSLSRFSGNLPDCVISWPQFCRTGNLDPLCTPSYWGCEGGGGGGGEGGGGWREWGLCGSGEGGSGGGCEGVGREGVVGAVREWGGREWWGL